MRRTTSSLIIAFLCVSLFAFAYTVKPTNATSQSIYINPDGSITPSNANITTIDNRTYNFTGNNYLPVIVNRSNIVIDGKGYTLRAFGVDGFSLTGINNVTIKNTTMIDCYYGISLYVSSGNILTRNSIEENFAGGILLGSSSSNVVSENNVTANGEVHDYGIALVSSSNNLLSGNTVSANWNGIGLLYSSSNNTLSGNNVTANTGTGILLSSSKNTVSNNKVTSNGEGIGLIFSSSNDLSGNSILANGDGIYLASSSGNFLFDNAMASNGRNFGVSGDALSDYVNYVDTSNLVEGKSVYYLFNQSNIVISPQTYPGGIGYLGLVYCVNVTVHGLTFTRNEEGILLANTNGSRITNNNVTANNMGIILYFSSGDALSGNNVTANSNGIVLHSSPENILSNNNIIANTQGGIALSSSGNVLFGNYLIANGGDNDPPIFVYSDSANNKIYHNNFLNNKLPAYAQNSANAWDDGYPSGGNYWSEYSGIDEKNGPYQNITSGDGVGDVPYSFEIGYSNVDRYPLMAPFKTFNAGTFNNVSYSVGIVSNSTLNNLSFNATARILAFSVAGANVSAGFSRVTIPKALMWSDADSGWTVVADGVLIGDRCIMNDTAYTYIYFPYAQSIETIQIQSTKAVPELQPFMPLPLLMILTLVGAMIFRRKREGSTNCG